MISVIFWNLAGNTSVLPHVTCLAKKRAIDIFFLAESPEVLGPTLTRLNSLKRGSYEEVGKIQPKVRVLTRLGKTEIEHLVTTLGGETAIWSVRAPKLTPQEILIAATHLPAKAGGHTTAGQAGDVGLVTAELAEFEDKREHCNTVFVGDFNMNPYDPGMTLVTALHALMTAPLARKQDRRYRNRFYRRFYNPMWGLFGDRTPGPAGTYYWRSSLPHNTHWAIFDQVLLRPTLIDRLAALEILDSDGAHPLIAKDGAPSKNHLSDHLPLFFQLDV